MNSASHNDRHGRGVVFHWRWSGTQMLSVSSGQWKTKRVNGCLYWSMDDHTERRRRTLRGNVEGAKRKVVRNQRIKEEHPKDISKPLFRTFQARKSEKSHLVCAKSACAESMCAKSVCAESFNHSISISDSVNSTFASNLTNSSDFSYDCSSSGEYLHKHLKEFHVVCSTMRPHGIPEDYIKMKAFSFSLHGFAKDWLYLQPVLFNT
ncbi:hypothetical protein CR513_21492, partial [Mucuna pruriens]